MYTEKNRSIGKGGEPRCGPASKIWDHFAASCINLLTSGNLLNSSRRCRVTQSPSLTKAVPPAPAYVISEWCVGDTGASVLSVFSPVRPVLYQEMLAWFCNVVESLPEPSATIPRKRDITPFHVPTAYLLLLSVSGHLNSSPYMLNAIFWWQLIYGNILDARSIKKHAIHDTGAKKFPETTLLSRCGSPDLGAGAWVIRTQMKPTSTLCLESDYLTFLVQVLENVCHRVYGRALSLTIWNYSLDSSKTCVTGFTS